jgi:hypothetical protein
MFKEEKDLKNFIQSSAGDNILDDFGMRVTAPLKFCSPLPN